MFYFFFKVIRIFFFFFFFQAEDGIRDIGVTGVQTCALPIFAGAVGPEEAERLARADGEVDAADGLDLAEALHEPLHLDREVAHASASPSSPAARIPYRSRRRFTSSLRACARCD